MRADRLDMGLRPDQMLPRLCIAVERINRCYDSSGFPSAFRYFNGIEPMWAARATLRDLARPPQPMSISSVPVYEVGETSCP